MGTQTIIILLIVGVILFFLMRRRRDLVTDISVVVTILGGIAAVIVFVIPAATGQTGSTPPPSPTTIAFVTPVQVAGSETPLPTIAVPTLLTSTQTPIAPPIQVLRTETGSGLRKTYDVNLFASEAIVGYGDKFENNFGCVAFIIVGPGTYHFWLESGVWLKYANVTASDQEAILQEQIDILGTYYCKPEDIKPIRILSSTRSEQPQNNPSSELPALCGEPAFDNNLKTSNPTFKKPDNYSYGWISADKASIVMPDGKLKYINTQFVIIVDNMPYVTINNIGMFNGVANANGCWYASNDFYEQIAKEEICKKQVNKQTAAFYKVDSSGLIEIGTTANITCP